MRLMRRLHRRCDVDELAELRARLLDELAEQVERGDISAEAWAIAKHEAASIIDQYRYAVLNGRERADVVARAETSARSAIETWSYLHPVSRLVPRAASTGR